MSNYFKRIYLKTAVRNKKSVQDLEYKLNQDILQKSPAIMLLSKEKQLPTYKIKRTIKRK